VPVISFFLGKKSGLHIWAAVLLSLFGIYMLSISGGFGISTPDILILLSALAFAIQIILIDRFVADVDGVRMAAIQFLVCGILSAFPMLILERTKWAEAEGGLMGLMTAPGAWGSILYAGVLSCGVAYTLQIVGQKNVQPTLASLMMSFESVFCVLGGWLILHEHLSARQLAGCALVFIAILLAEFGESLKPGREEVRV
jgi:drug/metabolite transporter (DMT)-like permease